MSKIEKVAIFWFRRDLRIEDNHGLSLALESGLPVIPLFIFDTDILEEIEDKKDARVHFIHETLLKLKAKFESVHSDILIEKGQPKKVWQKIIKDYAVQSAFCNSDYEPYAVQRDLEIQALLKTKGIDFISCKDQVIFEKNEILKPDGRPYSIFTPYSKKWKSEFQIQGIKKFASEKQLKNCKSGIQFSFPSLKQIGFSASDIEIPSSIPDAEIIKHYDSTRNIPGILGTSRLGIHLRFGTVSVRHLVNLAHSLNETWLNELIWREFFKMILWHFPQVESNAFKPGYDSIKWRDAPEDFEKWKNGQTGFPLVDAGMRELNSTGIMHNRVRMLTASFLTKHLLIDWRLGEAYFASQLLDFDLSANNGNWQWAAGCGCDAAPYFRIFNPITQQEKFDPDFSYVKKWIPEFGSPLYPKEMLDSKNARERCLKAYKLALGNK